MRGPKPKKEAECQFCKKISKLIRGYCENCYRRCKKHGIIKNSIIMPAPDSLTKYQEEILTGLMLGDGCLYRRKETHKPYLTVLRQTSDKEYLIDNYNVFRDFCKKEIIDSEIHDARTKKIYYSSRMITRRCSVFEPYYNLWYPNGKKIIPRNIEFTPTILSIWFADDGHMRTTCSSSRYSLALATDSYPEEDIVFLKEKLCDYCNSNFLLTRKGNGFIITASDKGARSFLEIIDAVFPISMERKAHWRKPEALFSNGHTNSYVGRIGAIKDEKGRFKKL